MLYSSERISYGIIFFLNFLTGVEYGIVIPTALQYLSRFGGNEVNLGFCVSAFSLANLLSSPIMGKISDKTQNTKSLILIGNAFQISGNLIYFLGYSKMFIIGGRFVSGLGIGCLGCIYSDIVKTTELSQRSTRLSRVLLGRQIGLIIGPAFNLLVLGLDYQLGPFLLDNLSAPGLLMAVAWFILQLLVIFFYKNLPELNRQKYEITNTNTADSACKINSTERTRLLSDLDAPVKQLIDNESNIQDKKERGYQASTRIVNNSETDTIYIKFLRIYNDHFQEEVIALLFTTFTIIFTQLSLETFVTPFTKDYFAWDDVSNSILFAIFGIEVMVVYIIVGIISTKISDRIMLIIGLIVNLSSLVILIVWLPQAVHLRNSITDYLLFSIPMFLNVFTLPLITIPSISLLSKVTNLKTQGLTQGLRSAFVSFGCILGPNWTGSFYKNWYIFLGVLMGLVSVSICMSLLSFTKLKGAKQIEEKSKQTNKELLNEF